MPVRVRSSAPLIIILFAPLAQLDRASDYGSGGWGFEFSRARHLREVAQLGRALGLGPRGRRFKSCLPDHFIWGLSSAGRAPALHAGGQRFDPARLHHKIKKHVDMKNSAWYDDLVAVKTTTTQKTAWLREK